MMQYRACNRRPRQPRYRNKPTSHPHHGAYLAHVPANTCDRGVLDTYHCALEKAEEDGEDVQARFRHAEPGEYCDAVHECEGNQDVEARGLVGIPGGGYGPSLSAMKPGRIRPKAEEPLTMERR